ncbi:peptidase M48, Ste24p [Candidatus Moduliflexus flocculans]|uniref:Peptidase M48, Ste24p n=1 Tax=Candidatus Moduliflexus flocculans TaxID=1499966 RepID=A0A0S6VYB5_9BACT|nr:peptidase M48, Ste24p [Candidatus Moduliflexus flocculans]
MMTYFKRAAHRYLLFAVMLALFVSSCATVPITGRSQLSIIPDSTMLSMSFQQYDQFLQESKLSNDSNATAMVRNVGTRIQGAVEEYFADHNMSQELQNYAWEFNLVESDEVNAWCMPGGKVVVYTGILPITRDETGLAVVMGHEIAHAVAKHGAERMSQELLVQMGGIGLSVALENQPEETQWLWMTAFNVGAQFGALLPYSRLHESEADYLGLIFMAMAGYDPNEAVNFWGRMAAESGGQAPPEFMSTHPSDATRIRKIKEALPEIMNTYYRPQ